ncbi:MAG: hypothetical protein A2W93_14885 [Bacteroidetes bacterium GWF2_43_63]|nr:MAG: hypothetical protein A2W94_01455 [Bacteroidetes bacterium GWE2_42_42]OFY52622.1 MAG: hypothetical protein A2W93_14885 [Bacteroidetes bacterium GWF2_43_63]HBG69896.1 hypothetical protein [Bacteroidales bacterium]HCB62678.1 hypothetical protein [Bacteroidales bacterium]HCY23798.1 hypothetical protein [Bacteroidales bacterium]
MHSKLTINNIPPSEGTNGAEGHGTVVFCVVTTVPCSGRTTPLAGFRALRGAINSRNGGMS